MAAFRGSRGPAPVMLCHCRAPVRASFGDTRTPCAAGDGAVPWRASRGLGTTLCRQLPRSARRIGGGFLAISSD